KPQKPNTIAKSLAIGNPADGIYALDVVKSTNGGFGSVSDEEVIAGIRLLAQTEGIFAETAGGVTVATLKRLVENQTIAKGETVVCYITGNGLKTVEAMAPTSEVTATIKPSLDQFSALLQDLRS
ncbi:MAG: pyridoxal-phosphate dependent enzyme, partial [Acidimicrobiaceae bacterium]|nr:pyridoxal-phosphate dependent enzyme [Acidimicrobiaceae bacterium]